VEIVDVAQDDVKEAAVAGCSSLILLRKTILQYGLKSSETITAHTE
jgi:hypothetical protein